MNKYTLLLSTVILGLLLQSCVVSYGDYTKGQYTAIQSTDHMERDSSMYIFFQGESLDFDYQKIGEVEAEGEEYAKNGEILDHLKYKAWENRANGLINIKSGYKNREQGVLFDSESEDIYSSKYYSAIAVRIPVDSAFMAKYGNGVDTTFVNNVLTYEEKQSQRTSNQIVASFLGGIFGVILVIIAMAGA